MDKKEKLLSLMVASALLNPYDNVPMPRVKIKHTRDVPQYARKKVQGRNEKCNCGSGLKYKKCCGK